MSKNTPIEETFRSAFDNFEVDVNSHVWTNIEKQITSPTAPAAGNAASEGIKTLATAGKISTMTFGIASTIIIAMVAATYFYFSSDHQASSDSNLITITQPSTKQENNLFIPSEQENTANVKHGNKNASQKINQNQNDPTVSTKSAKTLPGKPDGKEKNDDNAALSLNNVTNTVTAATQPIVDEAKPVSTSDLKETNNSTSANEKHETTTEAEVDSEPEKLPLIAPTQNDNFNWGVIANSISPNNDGLNDVFSIKTEGLKSLDVTISDRFGKTIYKWNGINGSWDGRDNNGKEMPSGFYLYYIFAESVDGKAHSKKGTLYIFR